MHRNSFFVCVYDKVVVSKEKNSFNGLISLVCSYGQPLGPAHILCLYLLHRVLPSSVSQFAFCLMIFYFSKLFD